MNSWESTLVNFRELGGVADNIELREGHYGRGLFSEDPNKPVKLFVPKNLMPPSEWLQLDAQGCLILSDACDWAENIKSFYLDYLRNYGLNDSLLDEIKQYQSQIFDLPESLKVMMKGYGFPYDFFQEPTQQACLDIFKKSRRIIVDNKLVMMPLAELVNHNERSKKSFQINKGIGITGYFTDEILVHYGMIGDAAAMFETYGFSAPKAYTFSGSLAINLGHRVIKIARLVNLYKTDGKTNVPKLHIEGNEIYLSCLVLGSNNDKTSPKRVFAKLMHQVGMQAHIADSVFDGILNQNQSFFLHLLEELKPLEGSVVEDLRSMARNQLIPLGIQA